MARTRRLFAGLTRRGPHKVLRGDLAFAGIPGVVHTPATGFHLPAVAFGHDWLAGPERYAGTLAHLASWGIVVAAPATGRGPAPSVLTLRHDLNAALDVVSGVRLGRGDISVARDRLALAGVGFGAAAAVLAAASRPAGSAPAKAVAVVFPSVTKPSAEAAAATLGKPDVRGLVLATPDDAKSLRTDAREIAGAWQGSLLRVVDRADASGLVERRNLLGLLGLPARSSRVQKTIRALLTGFLLWELTGDKTYREFADPDAVLPRTSLPDPDAAPVTVEDRVVALLR
ncbi:MAG: hypothetical protein ACKOB8_06490 [Mycobacterium sp.]